MNNIKHQTPNTKESSNARIPTWFFDGLKDTEHLRTFGVWGLEFIWCLVFDVWCFNLRCL